MKKKPLNYAEGEPIYEEILDNGNSYALFCYSMRWVNTILHQLFMELGFDREDVELLYYLIDLLHGKDYGSYYKIFNDLRNIKKNTKEGKFKYLKTNQINNKNNSMLNRWKKFEKLGIVKKELDKRKGKRGPKGVWKFDLFFIFPYFDSIEFEQFAENNTENYSKNNEEDHTTKLKYVLNCLLNSDKGYNLPLTKKEEGWFHKKYPIIIRHS